MERIHEEMEERNRRDNPDSADKIDDARTYNHADRYLMGTLIRCIRKDVVAIRDSLRRIDSIIDAVVRQLPEIFDDEKTGGDDK